MLSVHPARTGDVLTPQAIRFDPPVEAREYRDVFDNICHRIVAPPGQLTIAADFTVQDSGQPDPVVPEARQIPVQDLPDDVLIFLLGSRYCDTDKLSQTAWSLFGGTPEGWARVQAIVDFAHTRLRFDYQQADATRTAFEPLYASPQPSRSASASMGRPGAAQASGRVPLSSMSHHRATA